MAAFFKWHGGLAYGPRLLAETTWVAIYCACDVRIAALAPAVRDNPIAATLDALPPDVHIAVDSPPRSRLQCVDGRVITQ